MHEQNSPIRIARQTMRVGFLKKAGGVQRECSVIPFDGSPDAPRRTDAVQPVLKRQLCRDRNVTFSFWMSTISSISVTSSYSYVDRSVPKRVIRIVLTQITAMSQPPQSSTASLPSAQSTSLCSRHVTLSDSMPQFAGLLFVYSPMQSSTSHSTSLLTLRATRWR